MELTTSATVNDNSAIDKYGYQWRLEPPEPLRTAADTPIDDWLAELWDMRGRIIYRNGYRPSFRNADGTFSDLDRLDASCFHVTARLQGKLVGCVRLIRYSDVTDSWAQRLLGRVQLKEVIETLDGEWRQTAECGRWIVAPEQRGNHLGRYLMSGVYATARWLDLRIIFGLSGTHERQDLAFMSMGWRPVAGFDTLPAPKFNDDLRFIYFDVDNMSRREQALSDRLASLLGVHRQDRAASCLVTT